jgi:phosphoribosylanthranilate isomerase
MTWIKICGITNLEDALTAVEAGTNAVGFVFHEKSPRRIAPERVREIIEKLPAQVEKVGVNEFSEASMNSTMGIGLTALQHHVHLTNESFPQNGMGVGFTAHASTRPLKIFLSFPANLLLQKQVGLELKKEHSGSELFETIFLDSGEATQPGGTGKIFDWSKAIPIADGLRHAGMKLVVAGGLTPDNVAEAMRILHPWGVDVSSGVEERPGKKDHDKVRAFIRAVREADKASSN